MKKDPEDSPSAGPSHYSVVRTLGWVRARAGPASRRAPDCHEPQEVGPAFRQYFVPALILFVETLPFAKAALPLAAPAEAT